MVQCSPALSLHSLQGVAKSGKFNQKIELTLLEESVS